MTEIGKHADEILRDINKRVKCPKDNFALGMISSEIEALRTMASSAEAAVSVLEEIVNYRGGADSALEDEYVMERAHAAIAKIRGESP